MVGDGGLQGDECSLLRGDRGVEDGDDISLALQRCRVFRNVGLEGCHVGQCRRNVRLRQGHGRVQDRNVLLRAGKARLKRGNVSLDHLHVARYQCYAAVETRRASFQQRHPCLQH
jgi:hypothetical protein